ncbi:MAG: lysophospholipid acyltransferase family protein [Gemmatimonadota bacterium]
MIYLRNVWLYVMGLLLTAYWASRVVLHSLRDDPCALDAFCERAPRTWSRGILKLAGVEVEVERAEDFVPDRPQIVVANHASWFDVFAVAAHFPGSYHFVAKQELARIPIFGAAWLACGHIAIDRTDLSSAVASLERAADKIRSDDATIVMFPEGTRSPTGELQPFKKGAFMLALKADVPVVPVGILGSREVMPKHGWLVRPGRIRIRFGDPIPVDDYTVKRRDDLVRTAHEAVAELLDDVDVMGPAVAPKPESSTSDDEATNTNSEARNP